MPEQSAENAQPHADEMFPSDQRFAHMVEENAELRRRALMHGNAVMAVCGKVWVPSRNPDAFTLCPECVEHVRRGWMA